MSSPSSVSSSAPASATATSLDRQQTHIAREARVLHESVLKRVTAAEAEAALAAAKASTLMRGVETDALTALQQMEQMALYDLDAGVKEQLSAAQTRATDVQDENVRRLIFDNLYADVADETKKRQVRTRHIAITGTLAVLMDLLTDTRSRKAI